MRAGRFYFVEALISGPLFGALGGIWAKRRSALVTVAVALLFAFEPLAVWADQRRIGGPVGAGELTHYRWMWASEVLVGLTSATLIAFPTLRRIPDVASNLASAPPPLCEHSHGGVFGNGPR